MRAHAASRGGFRILDLASAAYLIFAAAVVLALDPTGAGWPPAALYLLLAVALAALALWCEPYGLTPRRGYGWRSLATVALVAFAWGELPRLMRLVDGGDLWATGAIVRADELLFGGHPTVMVQSLYTPWLDELMAVFNLSYYLFLALPVVLLLRRMPEKALAAASIIAVTYTTIFAFFLLVPVKGPQHSLGDFPTLVASDYGGYGVAATLRALQSAEGVVGGAFPSSHVAGSVACAVAAAWWLPRLGAVLLPLALGVAGSTVYLGYHHAVDAIAGIGWGVAAAYATRAWARRRDEWPH